MHFLATTLNIARLVYSKIQVENVQVSRHFFDVLQCGLEQQHTTIHEMNFFKSNKITYETLALSQVDHVFFCLLNHTTTCTTLYNRKVFGTTVHSIPDYPIIYTTAAITSILHKPNLAVSVFVFVNYCQLLWMRSVTVSYHLGLWLVIVADSD